MEKKYACSNLLSFDSVMDTDLGIINFMIDKYKRSMYFNKYVINASSENVKKNLLLARLHKNPLKVLLKEEFWGSADDMWNDVKKTFMANILEWSNPNDLLRFTKTLEETDGVVKCTINCKTELEKQHINKLDNSLQVVMNETDMSKYDCLFVKDADSILQYKGLEGKYIFISNYMYNIDQKTGLPTVAAVAAAGINKIRTVDPYIGLTIPKIGGEEE